MKMKIEIPTNCPSCDSELEIVNQQLFCRNPRCPAQTSKKVEAFAKKLRIKGLGPSTINKLDFVSPKEIFTLSKAEYISILGEKIGTKLFDQIENAKHTSFSMFLSGLSIPLVGETASKKIAEMVNSISELDVNLDKLPIGEKAKSNIRNALDFDGLDFLELESFFTFTEPSTIKTKAEFKGNVCITGKLNNYKNRSEAAKDLEALGYKVTSGVSKNTNYLVDEEGKPSSKRNKAESLGIPIVSIETLIG